MSWWNYALNKAAEIKGHLGTIGFILGTLGLVVWTVAKPYADDFVRDHIQAEGFASSSAVQEIQKIVEEQQIRTTNMNSAIISLQTQQSITSQQVDNLEELIKDKAAEQREELREIRRLLLLGR